MPLVVVVPLPATREIVLPSTLICSKEPSVTLETVKVSALMDCAASIVEIAGALNKVTGVPVETPAPSVKVPPAAVAVSVGASFTGTTETVDTSASVEVSTPPFAVPPLSFNCVMVKTRLPAVGSSLLVS